MASVRDYIAPGSESPAGRQPVLARPIVTVFVLNFWEPYSSDRARIDSALEDVKGMGFDTIVLDSKSSEDFFQYAEKGIASSFVAMQLHMMESAKRNGLGYIFMGLWAGGDNLGSWGQRVREFDPRMPKGCRRVSPEGRETHWYNYSSPLTLDVTSQHLVNLLTCLRNANHCSLLVESVAGGVSGGGEAGASDTRVLPLISHWDPSIFDFESRCMGSYDVGTIREFRDWLRESYRDVAVLNSHYRMNHRGFESVDPPRELFDRAADADGKVNLPGWIDWLSFLGEKLTGYLGELTEAVKRRVPEALMVPCLQQWGLLFNLELRSGIGWRGVNPFEICRQVDGITAIPFPVDAHGRPDPYAVSCEASLLASAARAAGKLFVGSMFLGVKELWVSRRVTFDMISPEEHVGVLAAQGAQSLFCYGYNGEDDGGNLVDQPADIKLRLRNSFEWYREIHPYIREGRVSAKVAIIFPYSAFLEEPGLEPNLHLRDELLGWYKLLSHCHIPVDFVDPVSVKVEILEGYSVLILPWWENPADRRGRMVISLLQDSLRRGCTVYVPGEGSVLGAPGPASGPFRGRLLTALDLGIDPGLSPGLNLRSGDEPNPALKAGRENTFPACLPGCFYQHACLESEGEAETLRARVARVLREIGVHPLAELEGDDSHLVEVSRFRKGILFVNHSRCRWEGIVRLGKRQVNAGLISPGPADWAGSRLAIGSQNAVFVPVV